MPTHQLANSLKTVARALGLVVILACVATSGPAYANGASNEKQAASQALKENGGSGEVLGVSKEKNSRGKSVFAVKIIENGRVRVIRIPQN